MCLPLAPVFTFPQGIVSSSSVVSIVFFLTWLQYPGIRCFVLNEKSTQKSKSRSDICWWVHWVTLRWSWVTKAVSPIWRDWRSGEIWREPSGRTLICILISKSWISIEEKKSKDPWHISILAIVWGSYDVVDRAQSQFFSTLSQIFWAIKSWYKIKWCN